MKRIVYLLCFCALTISVYSQDVIIKKDGSEIKAKVEEVTTDLIKYREQENLSGPLYSIPIAEIFKVNYSNGTSRFYGDKKEAPVTNVSKYDSLMKISKGYKTAGIILCVTGPAAMIAGGVFMGVSNGDPLLLGLGAGELVLGAILTVWGAVDISKSRRQYEAAQLYKSSSLNISMPIPVVNFANRGIGIGTTIRF